MRSRWNSVQVFHPTFKTSDDGDEHPAVRILVVNLSSH
jgi:hypothetical protein